MAASPPASAVLRAALATMPTSPGVYRMLDAKGEALYVGKARSLKKRVTAYTQPARLPERLRRMVSLTASMEVITTHTEAEALLLEANLIKRLKPRYNIVLRDDKSYPWLHADPGPPVSADRQAPRRAARKGSYWGPFASAWAVNQTVTAMQRVFLLRSCADTVFAARTRPCLLFQIKRCSAPCVGRISPDDYAKLVAQAKVLHGGQVGHGAAGAGGRDGDGRGAPGLRARRRGARPHPRDDLRAGQRRDQPRQPARRRRDRRAGGGRADLRAGVLRPRRPQQRQPRLLPGHARNEETPEVLGAFIAQFYDDKPPPPLVLVNHALPEQALVAEALGLKAGRKVESCCRSAAKNTRWWTACAERARGAGAQARGIRRPGQAAGGRGRSCSACRRRPTASRSTTTATSWAANAYGVMIVAGPEGFTKAAYRKFGFATSRGPDRPRATISP